MPELKVKSTTQVLDHIDTLGRWDQKYVQISSGKFEGSISEIEIDGINIFREKMNMSVQQMTSPPPDTFAVSVSLNQCKLEYLDWRKSLSNGQGLMNFKSKYHLLTNLSSDLLVLDISQHKLNEHAEKIGLTDLPKKNLGIHLTADCITTALKLLENQQYGDHFYSQANKRILDEILLSLDVAIEPNKVNYWKYDRKKIVNDACYGALEYGVNSIDLETLCQFSNVGIRILQLAFKEVLGISPLKWLKIAKLNEVRKKLLTSMDSKVTEIALDYDFNHFGRFSAEYKQMFLEYPSQTVRGCLKSLK